MPVVVAAIVLTLFAQQAPRDAALTSAPKGTAVIRGRVVSPGAKRPIAGARVSLGALPLGRTRPRMVFTDAGGTFEFTEIPAGTYGVAASPASYQKQFLATDPVEIAVADGRTVEGVALVLRRAAVIVGRLVDEFGQPIGGVSVLISSVSSPSGLSAAYAASDELGRFRAFGLTSGAYYLQARSPGFSDPNVKGSQGLVDTYYPGTPSRGEAVRIDLGAGEEKDVGDLLMLRGRFVAVRGMVVDPQGLPASPNRTSVSLSCNDNGSQTRNLDAQSRFDFAPGPPGACRVTATVRAEQGRDVEQYAAQAVTLMDEDVDVLLTLKPAVSVKGRVVVEDSTQPVPPTLSIRADRPGRFGGEFWIDAAPVARDLTFTFPRLAGELLLRTQGNGGVLALKAVMRGDDDITDIPTEFKPDDTVRVILAPWTSGVQGTVTGDAGAPTASMAVILFSEDRRTWVPWSTRVQVQMRTDRTGHYVGRAPPGRYYLVAVPLSRAIVTPDRIDPALLEPLVKDAITVVIAPGEIRVVDLQLASGG